MLVEVSFPHIILFLQVGDRNREQETFQGIMGKCSVSVLVLFWVCVCVWFHAKMAGLARSLNTLLQDLLHFAFQSSLAGPKRSDKVQKRTFGACTAFKYVAVHEPLHHSL